MRALLADKPRYYWDACMWIALIKREQGRFDACSYLIEQAQRGKIEIWTSAFTYAEVYKRNCSGASAGIDAADDSSFEDYIEQEFVQLVQVDSDVGRAARRLLRQYPSIGKPQDAVHIASALLLDVHELHTFDRQNLLALDGKLKCQDETPLKIKVPPTPPSPDAGTLFEGLKNERPEKKVG
ncbi:MAG: PIN domain-containing protein [Alphaproteobacteria bacterium]|nr:PIN domain-containing protein [Alphaproteobacteria bacterium]